VKLLGADVGSDGADGDDEGEGTVEGRFTAGVEMQGEEKKKRRREKAGKDGGQSL
jgi:hypothetical protein